MHTSSLARTHARAHARTHARHFVVGQDMSAVQVDMKAIAAAAEGGITVDKVLQVRD